MNLLTFSKARIFSKVRFLKVAFLSLLGGALALHLVAAAPTPEIIQPQIAKPARVLFVGNSYFYYNNSLHNHVRRIVSAIDFDLNKLMQYKSATIGGASLDHHNVDWLTQTGAIGVSEPFELVILAGNSGDALSEKSRAAFAKTVMAHHQTIVNRGAKTALYMTPAYVAPHKDLNPQNMSKIEDMYVSVGNDIKSLVIPVGLAFAEAYRRDPTLKLHDQEDGSHPSAIGTYLAACMVVRSVYGLSPVGNSYRMFGLVDATTALQLQQVAQDVGDKFFSKK